MVPHSTHTGISRGQFSRHFRPRPWFPKSKNNFRYSFIMTLREGCIFCKIIMGKIPCHRLMETGRSLAFLDVNPVSRGHILVIPKHCGGSRLHQIPAEYAAECINTLQTLADRLYSDCAYNVLQNNGELAHQEVSHVHFHLIPKRSEDADVAGLVVGWPVQKDITQQNLALLAEEMRLKLA